MRQVEINILWYYHFKIYFFLQEDEDGHSVVLSVIQDLMVKSQEIFLDHFARLGIFTKVQALGGPLETQESEENEPASEGKNE